MHGPKLLSVRGEEIWKKSDWEEKKMEPNEDNKKGQASRFDNNGWDKQTVHVLPPRSLRSEVTTDQTNAAEMKIRTCFFSQELYCWGWSNKSSEASRYEVASIPSTDHLWYWWIYNYRQAAVPVPVFTRQRVLHWRCYGTENSVEFHPQSNNTWYGVAILSKRLGYTIENDATCLSLPCRHPELDMLPTSYSLHTIRAIKSSHLLSDIPQHQLLLNTQLTTSTTKQKNWHGGSEATWIWVTAPTGLFLGCF